MSDLSQPKFSEEGAFEGDILGEVTHSAMYENEYECMIRATRINGRGPQNGKAAYLVLESGETVPILITGIRIIHPTAEAIQSGKWQPLDTPLIFRAPDLTEEQMKQARKFVQP